MFFQMKSWLEMIISATHREHKNCWHHCKSGFLRPRQMTEKIFTLSHLFFKNPQPTSHHRINDMQFNDHYFYNFKSQVLRHPLSHDSFVPRQSKRRCGGKALNEEEFLVRGSNFRRGTVPWHKLVEKKRKNITVALNFCGHSVFWNTRRLDRSCWLTHLHFIILVKHGNPKIGSQL